MNTGRRNLLKTIGAMTALGAINPSLVTGAGSQPKEKRGKSNLPDLKADVIVVGAGCRDDGS
jgi:hypothetical protein